MEELKRHLSQCKKVTVREYISQTTGEIRLYIQFHFLKGVKELSFSSTEEVTKLIDNYLMGKQD
jgi:hypothetical protein